MSEVNSILRVDETNLSKVNQLKYHWRHKTVNDTITFLLDQYDMHRSDIIISKVKEKE